MPILTLLLAVAGISILWPSLRGAPWVPTSRADVRKMLAMADVGPGDLVYDLGSGDGRVLVTAAREFGARAVGIEIDPLRYLWTQVLIAVLGLRGQVRVVRGDFFEEDLSQANVVTAYLTQVTNLRLKSKLARELRPGTRVVSKTFTFPMWPIARKDTETGIYMYRVEKEL